VEVISGYGEMAAVSEVLFGGSTRLETVYDRFDLAKAFVIAGHSSTLLSEI